MDEKIQEWLQRVDQVVEQGPYHADWLSLGTHAIPHWYQNSKFGIFIHWGVYSVPAFGNEWYPRNMYLEGTPEFEHHKKTYGPQKEFGYQDFIPLFRAEHFDAAAWMRLFREAGARYVVPVAEHHDGFQMYNSDLSDWCAAKKGPKRDVLGELKKAAEQEGLTFGASSHRAENYWFYGGAGTFDSGLKADTRQEPYGYVCSQFTMLDPAQVTADLYYGPPCEEHLQNWLARTCELVDRYQPSMVWFDWWIQNLAFKPYLKKFAAYYYNRAAEWGKEVVINYKHGAFPCDTAVYDVERGQLEGIRTRFWQTDTAIAKNSWCYTEGNCFKAPEELVCALVDTVSKNGGMLLNVGPKADGTITPQDAAVLRAIGKWLEKNGEGVFDTGCWETYGEGPTQSGKGAFSDSETVCYTSQDFRFTYRAPFLYAFVLSWPEDGRVLLRTLGWKRFQGELQKIEVLGNASPVCFHRDDGALSLEAALGKTTYPVCFKITLA